MYLRRPTTTSINSSCVASSRMTTSALWMPFFVVVNTGTKKACITVFVEDQNDSVLVKVRQLDRGVERDASALFDLKVNVWRPCIEADADIVELLCEQLSFFRSGMKNVFFWNGGELTFGPRFCLRRSSSGPCRRCVRSR